MLRKPAAIKSSLILTLFLLSACGSAGPTGIPIDERPPLSPETFDLSPVHDGYLEYHTESNINVVEDSSTLLISQFDDVAKRRAYLKFELTDEDGIALDLYRASYVKLELTRDFSVGSNPRPVQLFLMDDPYIQFNGNLFGEKLGLLLGTLENGNLELDAEILRTLSGSTIAFMIKVDGEDEQAYDAPATFFASESGASGPNLVITIEPPASW